MDWKNLIGNKEAKEIYEILREIRTQDGDIKPEQHDRINELSDLLNNEGFDDSAVERYVDWVDMNRMLGNNITNL